jgi:hypothetical protein
MYISAYERVLVETPSWDGATVSMLSTYFVVFVGCYRLLNGFER